MTVGTQDRVAHAVGNGVTRTWSFSPQVIWSADELVVVTTVTSTGVETPRTRGTGATNYSVSTTAFPGTGTIDYPAAGGTLLPSTETITIRRVLTLEQLTRLETQGGYDAQVQEDQFDKLLMMLLQHQEELDRCLRFPTSYDTAQGVTASLDGEVETPIATDVRYLRLSAARDELVFAALATNTSSAGDAVPQRVSTAAGTAGTSANFARDDHTHQDSSDIPTAERQSVDPSQKITLYEDFLGDTLDGNKWNATAGSGTGNTVTMNAGAGGRFNLLTSSADAANSANGSAISSAALNWRADQGGLILEVRLQVDDITNVMFFAGFSDVESTTVEAPIFLNGANIDSDATDACGVGFDTDGTTDEFFHGGVDSGVDTTPAYSGSAPVNATYVILRVEVSATGGVRGYVNGAAIGAEVASAVTPTVALCPYIVCINRSGAARNLLIDYAWIQANR